MATEPARSAARSRPRARSRLCNAARNAKQTRADPRRRGGQGKGRLRGPDCLSTCLGRPAPGQWTAVPSREHGGRRGRGHLPGCSGEGGARPDSPEPSVSPLGERKAESAGVEGDGREGRAKPRPSPQAPWERSARIGFQLSCGGQSSPGRNRRRRGRRLPRGLGNPRARFRGGCRPQGER